MHGKYKLVTAAVPCNQKPRAPCAFCHHCHGSCLPFFDIFKSFQAVQIILKVVFPLPCNRTFKYESGKQKWEAWGSSGAAAAHGKHAYELAAEHLALTHWRRLSGSLKVNGRCAVRLKVENAADVRNTMQRDAHTNHELTRGDVDTRDPFCNWMFHL